MTLGWVTFVSVAPPLLLLGIHPSRYTHDLLRRSEQAVLNIPGRALAETVLRCGQVSGRDVDKVRQLGLVVGDAQRVDAPWLDACLAHLELAVVDILQPGDHALFIAQVVDAWAERDAFQDTWSAPDEELSPLYHLGGNALCLLGQRLAVTPSADGDRA
jgi:flavin reductase (DIM6/NTAB) family NADH-FMN oxidoreductase RutF